MSIDLKPCPFCGGEAHFEMDESRWEWIECASCGLQGNRSASLMDDCKPKLAEAWNRRSDASLADAQAEIARLRGALEDYATLKDEVIGLRQRLQREHTMRKELEEEDFARRYNQTTYGL